MKVDDGVPISNVEYQLLSSGPELDNGRSGDEDKLVREFSDNSDAPSSAAAMNFRELLCDAPQDVLQVGDTREEFKAIVSLAGPLIATAGLQISMGFIDSIIVGHIGQLEFAAAALGNMWFNCLWFFCFGFLSAVDTFATQAFGAGRMHELNAIAWRGSIVSLGLMSLMAVGLWYGEPILSHCMSLDTDLAALVATFTRALIPGLWPLGLFTVLQKYLHAKNEMRAPVLVAVVSNLFNAIIGYTLVYRTPLGFQGAPMATSFSRLFMCLCLWIYVVCQREKYGLNSVPWSAIFRPGAFRQFALLGLPGAIMTSIESWAFDATTLMAGLLHDNAALASHSIALNLVSLTFFAFPFGLGIACTIRIGNLLGAGRGEQARLSYLISMALGCGSMAVAAAVFVVSARVLGYIWSSDWEVVWNVAHIMPIVAVYQFLDGFQGVASGAMRGMGRQKAAALLNLASFWGIGIPLGYILGFKLELGLRGIWCGTCCGLVALSIGDALVLARGANWVDLASEVHSHLKSSLSSTPPRTPPRSPGRSPRSPSRSSIGDLVGTPKHHPVVVPVFDSDSLEADRAELLFSQELEGNRAPAAFIALYADTSEHSASGRARAAGDWLLGLLYIFLVAVIWTFATVLKQIVFWDLNFDQPFYLTYICNSCYMMNIPLYFVGRFGGCMDVAAEEAKLTTSTTRSAVWRAALLGAGIAPIWYLAQWTYSEGVSLTSVTSSTVICATSCAWTYVLSVLFLGERLQLFKVLGLLACLMGNAATLIPDIGSTQPAGAVQNGMRGNILCLLSAALYATYTTILRKYVRKDVPIVLFFGILGCIIFLGIGPVAVANRSLVADTLTPQIVGILVLNGMFDNVLSQYLWARAVMLTSPTVATVGLSLTIPLAIVSDSLRRLAISRWQLVAAFFVLMGFVLVNTGGGIVSSKNGNKS